MKKLMSVLFLLSVVSFGFMQIAATSKAEYFVPCCNNDSYTLCDMEHSDWDITWGLVYPDQTHVSVTAEQCYGYIRGGGQPNGWGTCDTYGNSSYSSHICGNRCDWTSASSSLHCISEGRMTCDSYYSSVVYPAPQGVSSYFDWDRYPVLTWTDNNSYEQSFKIYRDSNYIGQTTGTSFKDTGVRLYGGDGPKLSETHIWTIEAYTPVRTASSTHTRTFDVDAN